MELRIKVAVLGMGCAKFGKRFGANAEDLMVDFTDVDPDAIDVNMPVRMVFRIKDLDEQRGFVRYFWKAAPAS